MNNLKTYDTILTDMENIASFEYPENEGCRKKMLNFGKFVVDKIIDAYVCDSSNEFHSLKTVEIKTEDLAKFNTSRYVKATKQRLPVTYKHFLNLLNDNGIIYVNGHYGEKDGKHFSKSYGLTFEYAYMLKGEINGELSPEKYAKKLYWLCTANDIIREYWHCPYHVFWKATLNDAKEKEIRKFIDDTKERMNDFNIGIDSTLFDIWGGELIFPRKHLIKQETEEEMKRDLDKHFS